MMQKNRDVLLPFVLTAAIILIDQLTKLIIVKTIPYHTVGLTIMGDFIRIIHTRNLGMAFSLGDSFGPLARRLLFLLAPTLVMIVVCVYYVKSNDLTNGMRWALAGILGGGIGNIIDRAFRPLGVVDFVDVRIYGFLGMERWPVFNVADSSVVVSSIVLVLLFVFAERKERKERKEVHEQES